jgi:hypothetical protein
MVYWNVVQRPLWLEVRIFASDPVLKCVDLRVAVSIGIADVGLQQEGSVPACLTLVAVLSSIQVGE